MSAGSGKPGQVLGVTLTLTAYLPEDQTRIARAVEEIAPGSAAPTQESLPLQVLGTPSTDKAEWAYDLLEAAAGSVAVTRTWMDDEGAAARGSCPSCGSAKTQPYLHAGPGARVDTRCTACGKVFGPKTRRV